MQENNSTPQTWAVDRSGDSGFDCAQNPQTWIDKGFKTPFLFIDASTGSSGARATGQFKGYVGHRIKQYDGSRPSGLWGKWNWDGQTLVAEVEPLGYFSLFVYIKGAQVGISPSILQLLAEGADPSPDEIALAVFHRIGNFVGNDTPFKYIKVLPPNGQLVWRDGKHQINGGAVVPKVSSLSRAQAVEAFVEVPRATIRRFVQSWEGPIALPLTGGRDSRHVLLEMAHQGRKPDTCVTFHHGGKALNAEVQAARAIAERVGVRHVILGNPRKRLRDSLRALLMTQLCSDEHAQMVPMHDYFSGSGTAAIDGIGGDILTNPDDWAAEFKERANQNDYEGIAKRMVEGHSRVISRPGHLGGAGAVFSSDLHDAAIERIAKAIQVFDAAPDPYQAFWFYNRTRREISFTATAVMGGAEMVFCPYLDPEFVELGLSLDWSVTRDQKLHDDAIFSAYPGFSDIPFSSGFVSQPLARFRPSRVTNMLDTLRVGLMTSPDKKIKGLQNVFKPTPIWRGPSDTYRMHHDFVMQMDQTEARRLLELGMNLSDTAPKGENVVSNVHLGH